MSRKFYCYICKTTIYGRKEIKKHAIKHFNGKKCPYCNMKTKKFLVHFVFYHLYYKKNVIFRRDLAILCKELGNTKILNDKNLNLSKSDKMVIGRLLKKL